ncbi:hypothetical protein HOLleu_40925 [Holothuria leucospilota]|uniref:Uncharacterized protein n=1 Tax=Holothuria leucospilota TaxID=206669 RepID=A0A9Q1BAV6_HOLLE|nr:hypothetical protein HOLleu_40925 [Holothuria leucospilota]
MTQDTENLVDPPKAVLLRGASMRKWIGISQAGIAVVLVGLGITFLIVKPPLSPGGLKSFDENVMGLRIIGNSAVGIWGGMVFIITGTFGIFSGKTKNMVSLYLALCLASLLIAVIGLGFSGGAVALNLFSKHSPFYSCRRQLEEMNYDYNTIECCLSHYNCRGRYYGSFGDSYELPMECEQIQEQHEVCSEKVYVQLNPRVQMVRSTGTSSEIPQADLVTNGSQVPSVMMLNTAAQPNHLANQSVINSSQRPMQFIPTAQVS